MPDLALHIVQPVNGARIAAAGNVRLQGQVVSGSAAGLFFKWYSTLNVAATEAHPELNAADHSASALDWTTPLDVGTHVITLSAADRDGNDLSSVKQITRAASTGGAPAPGNTAPCVIHRFWATLRTPAANGATLSKAFTTLEARAPAAWAKKNQGGVYQNDPAYHALNGLRYRFRFEPQPANAATTAELIPATSALTFFIAADDKPYVRWQGALPGNLGTGAYVLRLYVESLDGTVGHDVSRSVNLTA
ncbi:MAG TPA: hypothetical protein VK447_21970 [Myxococcaceae bacterium]|nr:hypothetical protein [Myxococcaceae bacterium]